MATFQVCQPTGWTGLAVAWGVVRSLAGFVVAGPSGADYLGGGCLPWLLGLPVRALHYADIETVVMFICYGHWTWRYGFPIPIPCEHETRLGLDGVRRVRRDPDRCLRIQQSLK